MRLGIGLGLGLTAGGGGVRPIASFYASTLSLGAVANWYDSSGGGRTLTQGTAGNRPTCITDSRDGQKAVQFASGKTLAAAAGAFDMLHEQDCTVLIVWRTRDVTPPTCSLLATSAGATSKGYRLQVDSTSPLFGRVNLRLSDGSSDIIEQDGYYNNHPILLWTCTASTHSATVAQTLGDGLTLTDDTIAVTLPTGESGQALTLGNARIEVRAIEVYSPALTDAERDAAILALENRCGVSPVVTLAKSPGPSLDPVAETLRYYAYAGVAKAANGDVVAAWTNAEDHAATDGEVEVRRSTNGGRSWGAPSTVVTGSGVAGWPMGPMLTTLAGGGMLMAYTLIYASTPESTTAFLRFRRSADNGATWGEAVTVESGFTSWAQSASPIIEHNGKWVWPIYGKDIGDAKTSARVLVSANEGVSWTEHVIKDGEADVENYEEPWCISVVGGDHDGELMCLIRIDSSDTQECFSTDDGATWGALAQGPNAVGQPSLFQASDGTILMMGRHTTTVSVALYRRNGDGDWSGKRAGAADFPGGFDYAGWRALYGQITEVEEGVLGIATGVDTGVGPFWAEVHFRRWPLWHIRALEASAAAITPTSATLEPEATQAFAGSGGVSPYTYSATGAGGTVNASTGLFTASSTDATSATVTVTDYIDQTAAASVEVVEMPVGWTPADVASLELWYDPSDADSRTIVGGAFTELADKSGNGHTASAYGGNPPLAAAALNGLDAIGFDASAAFALGSLASLTAGEVFVVAKQAADPPVLAQGLWQLGAGTPYMPFTNGNLYDSFGSTLRQDNKDPGIDLSTAHIYNAISTSSEWTSSVNGTQIHTTGTNTVSFPAACYFGMNAAAVFYLGTVGELIICNAKLSFADRTRMMAYLRDKWGTP